DGQMAKRGTAWLKRRRSAVFFAASDQRITIRICFFEFSFDLFKGCLTLFLRSVAWGRFYLYARGSLDKLPIGRYGRCEQGHNRREGADAQKSRYLPCHVFLLQGDNLGC